MTSNPADQDQPESQDGNRPEVEADHAAQSQSTTPEPLAPENSAPETPVAPESAAAAQPAPVPAYAAPGYSAPQPAPHYAGAPAQEPAVAGASFGAPAVAAASTGATTTTTTPAKRSIAVPVIAALAVGALLGGAAGAGVFALADNGNDDTQTTSTSPQTITVNNTKDVNVTTAVAAKASPSVVTISVASTSAAGTGSGVILSADGYVLTNTHVVTLDGAAADGKVQVTTYDGKLYTATVIGTDPTVDLAVIKLDDASGLQPITFGDSSKLNVGDTAIAIGAPLGLSNTVTDGIVSALNRSIQIASSAAPDTSDDQSGSGGDSGDSGDGSGPFDFWQFDIPGQEQQQGTAASSTISIPVIQTDAAINPGNSGGALLGDDGKLIGINVAIASAGSSSSSSGQSGSIGVGFAIPADLAKRVSDEIIKSGSATHGLLGAGVKEATAEDGDTVGALIAEVVPGGAAEKAGIKVGDVVTGFDGHPITSDTDLTAQVRTLAGGDSAQLTYVRDGKSATVDVTLGTFKA